MRVTVTPLALRVAHNSYETIKCLRRSSGFVQFYLLHQQYKLTRKENSGVKEWLVFSWHQVLITEKIFPHFNGNSKLPDTDIDVAGKFPAHLLHCHGIRRLSRVCVNPQPSPIAEWP
jgi:hypothetical protein